MLLGSVTDLTPAHAGSQVIVGSHGGKATGYYALACGVASLICHDAGIGLDNAGVRTLEIFDRVGLPAAAVGHGSARIGDPEDMLTRGLISRANTCARALEVQPGLPVAVVHETFQRLGSSIASNSKSKLDNPFERHELLVRASNDNSFEIRIVLADSASLLNKSDDGRIVVTGSHGGLPGNASRRAAKAQPLFAVYNDAGIGIDNAGISRLAVLDSEGISAACVTAASARIGEAGSTYETGILSVVNNGASQVGLEAGVSVREAVQMLVDHLARSSR
jgi:hypothetical protein